MIMIQSSRRRGMVAIFSVCIVLTLLAVASLAVDVGHIYGQHVEAQNIADAAALAGALAIQEGTPERAEPRALEIIATNQKAYGYSSLNDQLIQLGRWDSSSRKFTPVADTDIKRADSVRVLAARNDVALFFAGAAGHTKTDVYRDAVARVSPICRGIWGIDAVTAPGNPRIDSYDSQVASYSTLTAGENGDLCSGRDLTIAGSVEVHGDVLAAPGYPVIQRGGVLTVTGDIGEWGGALQVPSVDFGDVEYSNDNGSIPLTSKGNVAFDGTDIKLKANDSLTLPPGRFYIRNIEFASGSKLNITGETEFYLYGDFNASGYGTLNTTSDPHQLSIYSTGSVISLTGSAAFYGSILAPNADVKLAGNADYYGAVIGKSIFIAGNLEFHVDESLPLAYTMRPPPQLVK